MTHNDTDPTPCPSPAAEQSPRTHALAELSRLLQAYSWLYIVSLAIGLAAAAIAFAAPAGKRADVGLRLKPAA